MVQYATARRLRAVNDSYQQEAEVLLQLGIGRPTIARPMQVARRNGASIEQELIASGSIDADSYYASLARGLRLPFLSAIDSSLVNDDKALDSQLLQARCVRLNYISKGMLAIVPEARNLVMREPARLPREMGVGGFLVFQLLIGGMLFSSLTHPWLIMLLVTTAGYLALGFPPAGSSEGALLLLDLANMAASYGLFLLLGRSRCCVRKNAASAGAGSMSRSIG